MATIPTHKQNSLKSTLNLQSEKSLGTSKNSSKDTHQGRCSPSAHETKNIPEPQLCDAEALPQAVQMQIGVPTPANNQQIVLPAIITANCYFWSPNASASGRRKAEGRRHEEVRSFLSALGFKNREPGLYTRSDIKIRFFYSESCRFVRKRVAVFRKTSCDPETFVKTNISYLLKRLSEGFKKPRPIRAKRRKKMSSRNSRKGLQGTHEH